MTRPLVLPLDACTDPTLVGGKAAGLCGLINQGFKVPPGLCITTEAYGRMLSACGINSRERWTEAYLADESDHHRLLTTCWAAILQGRIPEELLRHVKEALAQLLACQDTLLAVRSSATNEDRSGASFAGLYETRLGVPLHSIEGIGDAIKDCWASVWREKVLRYHLRLGLGDTIPEMAVIVQPVIAARASGVAFSQHPVWGNCDRVTINAVMGIAAPFVSGEVIPDHYVIQVKQGGGAHEILERHIAQKDSATRLSAEGVHDEPLSAEEMKKPALTDEEAVGLAYLTKDVEEAFQQPVDVEWAMEERGVWLLQARPIPPGRTPRHLTEHTCVWSRANFKETMPDVPSPLGLSFLQEFMERAILLHYRTLGCTVPPGLSSVRIIHGRPYINVSLFQHFMAQLGGDTDSITDQMGGHLHPLPVRPPRLAWWQLIQAGLWTEWQIRRAAAVAPRWFAELKRGAEEQLDASVHRLAPTDLLARLDRLGERLYEGDLTFAAVGGVSQGLYVLHLLLERRLGPGWRPLLNASLQGESQAISARQILWLLELAELARRGPAARDFLLADPWTPERFRERLTGTTFLKAFDGYLAEYGHRAVGESDVMAARFVEMPGYVLGIIRSHLLASSGKSAADIRRGQETARATALQAIRTAFGWRVHEWLVFRWWRHRLARYLALREANRHALMHFSFATRRIARLIGEHLTARGSLAAQDDIFFLTDEEIRDLIGNGGRDWKGLVAARRAERARHEALTVPDTVIGNLVAEEESGEAGESKALKGLPISSGYAEGPVRLVRSPEDQARVKQGDILVVPVIDPGLAPLLGLAAGLVAEMGGTLSHGAIIVREYGLPALANVHGVTRLLHDGERVGVDAARGEVRRLAAR